MLAANRAKGGKVKGVEQRDKEGSASNYPMPYRLPPATFGTFLRLRTGAFLGEGKWAKGKREKAEHKGYKIKEKWKRDAGKENGKSLMKKSVKPIIHNPLAQA